MLLLLHLLLLLCLVFVAQPCQSSSCSACLYVVTLQLLSWRLSSPKHILPEPREQFLWGEGQRSAGAAGVCCAAAGAWLSVCVGVCVS